MTLFRRRTGPPRSKAKDSGASVAVERKHAPRPSRDEIKPPLDALLKAETSSDEVAQRARRELLEVAEKYSPYLTASEIHQNVSARRASTDQDETVHKGRGLELAGELYYQHLMQEIHAIEAEGRRLGPSVFEDYCVELLECFISGENVRRGVGFAVSLVDHLIERFGTSANPEPPYLELAERALNSTFEFASRKLEQDLQSMKREMRQHRKGDTPIPEVRDPRSMADQQLLDYLDELKKQFEAIKANFQAVTPRPAGGEAATKEISEYLYKLIQTASSTENFGIAGAFKERLAGRLVGADQVRAATFARAAAVDFMAQGDAELKHNLVELGLRRYRRAHRLFLKIGDAKTAAELESKIASLTKSYDRAPLAVNEG